MKLLVSLDHRFNRTPDGAVRSWFFDYSFWSRYLEVFDEVLVLARVQDVYRKNKNSARSDGERVRFIPIPFYRGPMQYLKQIKSVKKAVNAAFHPEYAVILRSGHISGCLAQILQKADHPYGMEVIGDPYDVFAPLANQHPMRIFLRWWYPRQLRKLCWGASAAAYVTKETLQKRYPTHPNVFSTYYSSIELRKEMIVSSERNIQKPAKNLLTVGTMDQPYKGQDILIHAVAHALKKGIQFKLNIIGDGYLRSSLENLCRKLDIEKNVSFIGQVKKGFAVYEYMDNNDLFVLPSRTEGLPRSLIEAMARAMPCISTTVGGVPELLPSEFCVSPNDFNSLAVKIIEVSADVQKLNKMSEQNFMKSHDYVYEKLNKRRIEFYSRLKDITKQRYE